MHDLTQRCICQHPRRWNTNTYLLKSPLADEKSWIIICAKTTANSAGKKNPLSKAVHTFSAAVFQQWKGQAALNLFTFTKPFYFIRTGVTYLMVLHITSFAQAVNHLL